MGAAFHAPSHFSLPSLKKVPRSLRIYGGCGEPSWAPIKITKGRVMTVKARINGREYTLSWEEFEKALLRNDLSGGQIEVISIFTGMRLCYSLQVG